MARDPLIEPHLAQLRIDGALLAEAAAALGPDAALPTCPEWQMRDLVRHTGGVHRWATAHVRDAAPALIAEDLVDLVGGWPSDEALVAWFREGHQTLVDTLAEADPDLESATFLRARSPLAFWARRQAHETAIHRADAQTPTGAVDPFPPEFAADGIDELVSCFITRRSGTLRSDVPCTLGIAPFDADDTWTVHISTEPVVTDHSLAGVDCTVRGAASDIYLALWNRGDPEDLAVSGDTSVLERFHDSVTVSW